LILGRPAGNPDAATAVQFRADYSRHGSNCNADQCQKPAIFGAFRNRRLARLRPSR